MDPFLLLTWSLLTATGWKAEGLKCYACTVKKPSRKLNITAKLCSRFDASSKYVIDCPLSTFCETKTFRLHTQKDTVSVTTRGCADQDYSYQKLIRGKWRQTTIVVDEAYKDGCFNSSSLKNTEYCFCSTDLCNKDSSSSGSVCTSLRGIITPSLIAVFLVSKMFL